MSDTVRVSSNAVSDIYYAVFSVKGTLEALDKALGDELNGAGNSWKDLRYKSLQVMYNELHEGIVRTAHPADEYMARLKRIKDAIIGYSNDD